MSSKSKVLPAQSLGSCAKAPRVLWSQSTAQIGKSRVIWYTCCSTTIHSVGKGLLWTKWPVRSRSGSVVVRIWITLFFSFFILSRFLIGILLLQCSFPTIINFIFLYIREDELEDVVVPVNSVAFNAFFDVLINGVSNSPIDVGDSTSWSYLW